MNLDCDWFSPFGWPWQIIKILFWIFVITAFAVLVRSIGGRNNAPIEMPKKSYSEKEIDESRAFSQNSDFAEKNTSPQFRQRGKIIKKKKKVGNKKEPTNKKRKA